jgi:hypothetical protein
MADRQLTDKTGAVVTVEHDDARGAYALTFANGEVAGRTFHIPASAAGDEWIFFHTEVDDEYGGRGLGGILVGPFVKGWLEKNGDDFAAAGGAVRAPRPGDLDTVRNASTGA